MIRSEPFSITRLQLARAISLQYLRRFWFILIALPLFGILALAIGPTRLIQGLGLFCLLWPFSIPARAVLITSGVAKKLSQPTTAILDGDAVYLQNESGGGMKLPLQELRGATKRGDFYVLETRRFNVVLLPVSAFSANARAFEKALDIQG